MVEVKFYATLRELIDGNKSLSVDGVATVSELLENIVQRYPDLQEGIFDEDRNIRSFVAVMVNGRDVRHLNGIQTVLDPNDTLDIFPPVAGGSYTESEVTVSSVSIRGLPEWLIREYFFELGGATCENTQSLNHIVGDCWLATWSQQKVKIEGSSGMGLTQFDIVIEGAAGAVQQVMELFMKKAQRGGG